MRKILFRGKSTGRNTEWIYGWYAPISVSDSHGPQMVIVTTEPNDYMYMGYGSCLASPKFYSVDPDTIGQYTGSVDKNGVKIFEGDILKGHNPLHEDRLIYQVVYESNGFYYMDEDDVGWHPEHIENVEVIDNIHDNPELMEVI